MTLEYTDIRPMLEVAIVAARLAGQRAMEDIKYTKSFIKKGTEIVTQTDPICQEIIVGRIKETYPDHGFIGEEGTNGEIFKQSPRGTDQIWWVIDPIDGTNNYAHGLFCFCVSIAAFHDGVPIVGVIFDPATDSMYTAAKGADTQLNSSKISTSDEEINKMASFGIDSHAPEAYLSAVNEVMERTRFRNLGTTALQFAYVASGAMIGTITTSAKLWDFAAGAFLIENASGVVTDMRGNKIFPVDTDNYQGQGYDLIATNKKTNAEFLKMFK
jgi:myo-inositol-1(or 4)-monophosphatase